MSNRWSKQLISSLPKQSWWWMRLVQVFLVCVVMSDLAFQKSELLAGLWPDQSFWQWNSLFPRAFAEKPSSSCILFRIWLIWLDSFDGIVWPVSSDKWKAPWDLFSLAFGQLLLSQGSKKIWIPACPLGNQLSHFAYRGHFLFFLVNDFFREWFSWTLAHLPLP